MAFEYLHRAVGPAETLCFIGAEIVRHQSAPERMIHINGFIAIFEQTQAKFGVFANAPFRP